jgi:hypothetical protein
MKTFFDDLKVYREGLLAQGFWALQIYRFDLNRLIHNIRQMFLH